MILVTFGAIILLHSFVALHFAWRFVLRRKYPSLVCAMMPLGWVVAAARELKWLPRFVTTPLLASAFAFGVVAAGIILYHEAQRPRPFR